ncbi:MAG TPA: ABC transporter permease [Terriglobia bacterium]|nr:ABC transporter permease [Terriglobia bacterium]
MTGLRMLLLKFIGLFRKARLEQRLDEDVRAHLDMLTEENLRKGMTPEEARYAAQRQFGNVASMKEECRDKWGMRFVSELAQDLRYGLRQLRRNPCFTAVAVLTLALGIGANTAVFTVVNGVLLRPMPFPEADRLFLISLTPRGGPFEWQPGVADRDYLEFLGQNRAFEQIASFSNSGTTASLTGAGDPVQIPVAYVTTSFFATLRTNPSIGRRFLAGEGEPGNDGVAVLSNELWKERFGSDSEILGKTIRLDGVNRTVVGVMPAGFSFPGAKVWMPLAIRINQHNSFTRPVVGRLKPGVTPQQAQAELETFAKRLPFDPGQRRGLPQIIPLKDLLVANIRPSLLVFAGAVAFVLLIACANVANLFLARATGRGQELAVRSTLGASHWRLSRQLLAESTLVSLIGGAAGMLLAFWSVRALIALAPAGKVPRMEMIQINGWVLAFTFVLSALTGVVVGFVPAFQSTRHGAGESLKQTGRGVSAGHKGIRSALTISEMALAVILLTGAGLMLKSFLRLRAVNPGFSPDSVMTMTVDLPDSIYGTASQMQLFHTRTLAELSRLPGVLATGMVNWIPLGEGLVIGTFQVEGGTRPPGFMVDKPCVSPGYFRVMGIPLLRGREFTEEDTATAPGVVIVSESVARTLWPGKDPIGKRISMEDEPGPKDWLTVVGIVGDIKQQGLAKKSEPAIYQPYSQAANPFFLSHMTFVVRTALPPESVAGSLRAVLRNVDKNQPVSIASMNSVIAVTTAEPRFQTRLLTTFALMALVLTIVGIYGVLAYSVAQRTHEIGIRVALGAQKRDVLGMVIGQGLKLALIGVAIGVAGALALTRFLASLLYGVKPTDPLTFVAVSLTLIAVALVACYIPARRAAKVDPMVALRYE